MLGRRGRPRLWNTTMRHNRSRKAGSGPGATPKNGRKSAGGERKPGADGIERAEGGRRTKHRTRREAQDPTADQSLPPARKEERA